MCGCNQLSSFQGESQTQFGLDIPSRVEHSNFWPFSNKTSGATTSSNTTTDTAKTTASTDTTKVTTTTGQKIKGAINDGTVKNTSDAASSWLDTINKGINIFTGKTPVNNTASNSATNTDPSNTDTSTGIPSYVWWILGGLALLGTIWAGVHFSKQS
jgi:cobalamin biosynthesis Mg chelatase CobN